MFLDTPEALRFQRYPYTWIPPICARKNHYRRLSSAFQQDMPHINHDLTLENTVLHRTSSLHQIREIALIHASLYLPELRTGRPTNRQLPDLD